MAARRSSFRFRLPWSQDAPATQSSTRPNASTAPSPATRPAAGSKPATQATSTSNLSAAETSNGNQTSNTTKNTTPRTPSSPTQTGTKNNNQLGNTSTTPGPSTSNTDLGPAPTSTSLVPATPTIANSSAKTKSPVQSTTNSPARSSPQTAPSTPKVSQRPPFRPAGAASSPKNRSSRNESQPSSPPQATSKSSITSQPASPSGAAAKSRVSQSPSLSSSAPQSPAMTPTSSPARKTPRILSTKAGEESSNSPSVVKSQMQENNQAITWPTSPSKSLQERSEPSKSIIELSSIPGKEKQTEPTKKVNMTEAKLRLTDKAIQPSEETVQISTIAEGPSRKSDSSRITGESKMLKESATNNQETKEVKEVVQESRSKDYGAGEKAREVQLKKANIVNQEEANKDHILKNPVSNGRQTRTSTSQPRNKTVLTGSSHKSAAPDEPHIPIHKEIKDNISKVINRMAVGDGKQDTGNKSVNVITLAGDNRGASMQLGSDSSTKGGRIHIHRGYKINPAESADATTDDVDTSSKRVWSKDAKTMEDQTIAAYINCNVQGVNNSIVFNSSIAERNPGVHMSIPQMPSEPVQSSEETGPVKAKISARPARIIRRRCLRGLFLESSDSDPDKPRRHGCRVGCTDMDKLTT